MTTDQLTGRALDEAAARAMGWRLEMGAWYRGDGTFAGNHLSGCLTECEMLAWLCGRGNVVTKSGRGWNGRTKASLGWDEHVASAEGRDLREALARLVVAVKQRKATDGK